MEQELREMKRRLDSSSDLGKQGISTPHATKVSCVESDNSHLTGEVPQGPDLNERLTTKAIGDAELDPFSITALLEE